jgi:hypothetical protein
MPGRKPRAQAAVQAETDAAAPIASRNRKGGEWDDEALHRLWTEYKGAGATYSTLGQRYGLPHYRIASLLKQAKARFSTANKATPFNGADWKSKKQD